MVDASGRAALAGDAEPTGAQPTASASVFVATFAAVLALIGVLLLVDLSLARVDRNESAAHAANRYRDGLALLEGGRAADAIEQFEGAVAIDRENVDYALGLASAELDAGRTAEAEETLQSLLDRAENDGAVNLTMARVMVREGHADRARAYFHRAIFGRWGADSAARRSAARFELIDLLAREGASHELLAELLPLEDAPPDSTALRRRLGELFIRAGSPARGTAMLREVLRRDPRDADAYAGMGDAALASGNFRTARADFAEAARLRPDDARIAARAALADTVLALDPGARGIGARARFGRRRDLLARTVATLRACAPRTAAAALDSAVALVGTAAPLDEDATGERMVDAATALWLARPARCGAADALGALGVVLENAAR